jgi:hypothetical protein
MSVTCSPVNDRFPRHIMTPFTSSPLRRDWWIVIVQGVVRSGGRRWQAFFSQGPVAGSPQ